MKTNKIIDGVTFFEPKGSRVWWIENGRLESGKIKIKKGKTKKS